MLAFNLSGLVDTYFLSLYALPALALTVRFCGHLLFIVVRFCGRLCAGALVAADGRIFAFSGIVRNLNY